MSDRTAQNAAHMTANIIRVMRGGGRVYQILQDIEDIARASDDAGDDHGKRMAIHESLVSGAQSWMHDVRPDREIDWAGLCDSVLRFIAAKLDGNGTEYSKARGAVIKCLLDWREGREAWRRKDEEDAIAEVVADMQSRWRMENRVDAQNKKVLSAANDNHRSYVYFITDGEAIKIGKANNPKSRLSGLQTSHHKPLRILAVMPGDESLEKTLHGVFRLHHLRGEWFKDHKDIREFIKRHAESVGDSSVSTKAA